MVGEQPGDREDVEGRPFVGPAGALLDRALRDAGIDRGSVYLTNAVKHFRWTRRGKRRIHERPDAGHVAACRPWLTAEIQAVRPRLLVCLGATAARSLLGPGVSVMRERGSIRETALGVPALPTVHPSAVLRAPDDVARRRVYAEFVADLARAATWLQEDSEQEVTAVPGRQELPDTIKRSPARAQRTWVKAHDRAVETYGEGRRARMTAFAALKHSFEKVGDHWEPKRTSE